MLHGGVSAPNMILSGVNSESPDWTDKTWPELQREIMDQVEKLYLQKVLKKARGRVGQAARIAGIHPRGLYNKMKQFGLRKEDFK